MQPTLYRFALAALTAAAVADLSGGGSLYTESAKRLGLGK